MFDAAFERPEILHWRTSMVEEVDFVIEAGGPLLPVEVNATGPLRLRGARRLLAFRKGIRRPRAGRAS